MAYAKKAQISRARTRKYHVRFGSRQLTVTFRKFKTQRTNRSKRIQQYVLPLRLSRYREVALVYRRHKAHRRMHRYAYSLPAALIMAGIVGSVFFGAHLITHPTLRLETNKVAAVPVASATKVLPAAAPVRLRIPAIDVDTSLETIGLQPDGSIALPNGFDIAGWYKGGPTPGQLGPAVIVGHLDSTDGVAVFWRLRELKPGDTVFVDRQDGTVASFTVNTLQQYSQNAFPTKYVYGNINYAGLRIITCGGVFDATTHHYSDNTVVYASLQ